MTSAIKCPECGTELPSNVPPNMCPQCLLKIGLGTQSDQEAGATSERMPLPGSHFGHYEINRLLGKGGMGAVYEAQDLNSGRRVALKVLSKALNSRKARERFLHEGQLAASINHKNCVYVFGTEEINEIPVISMELVNGGTLADLVQESGPLPSAKAVDAILEIIAGLEAAQAVGVLHRDIKPANCFRDADGSIKVGDFGLSISTAPQSAANLITGGSFAGTPAFSSPEQLRGEELSLRSDIYAVGVTLYYLLTGKVPFEASNAFQLVAKVLEKTPESPDKLRREIPSGLSKVVMRCLEKNPTARYANYKRLHESLLPFNSTAPTPATIVSRCIAGIIDVIIINIICTVLEPPILRYFLILPGIIDYISTFVIVLIYFGVLEGIRGASFGKQICGLCVIKLNRSFPGISRSLLRATIFILVTNPPALISFESGRDLIQFSTTQMGVEWFVQFCLMMLALFSLLFATARRNNLYAGLHEILSKTRVTRKMRVNVQINQMLIYDEKTVPELAEQIGPYRSIKVLRKSQDEELLLCKDSLLKRLVWVCRQPAAIPKIADQLRDLSRTGRLRWINGHRSSEQSWDAYEAVPGNPFVKLLGHKQSWASVRVWLMDLVDEINAGIRDQSLPKVLKFDRVWITSGGHAKLLDFPAPAVNVIENTIIGKETATASPHQFLINFAAAGLGGRAEEAATVQPSAIAIPMPVHARQLLKELEDGLDLDRFEKRLRPALNKITSVSRSRRFALFCGTIVILPLMLISAFTVPYMLDFVFNETYPDLPALSICLAELQRLQTDKSTNTALSAQCEQLQIYISGHFSKTIADGENWKPIADLLELVNPSQFSLAEQAVSTHPTPSVVELAEASKAVKVLLGKKLEKPALPLSDSFSIRNILGVTFFAIDFFVVIPCLLAAILFRGGLVSWAGRVTVVKVNGMRASRMRLFLRCLIAALPYQLLLLPIRLEFRPFSSLLLEEIVGIGLIIMLLILTGWSVLNPRRSLQDRIAGTCLIPQ